MHYDKVSFKALVQLFAEFTERGLADQAGIKRLPSTEYWTNNPPTKAKLDSLKSHLTDFRIIPTNQLPEGKIFGIKYTTLNFFSPKFLVFLKDYLTKHGVTFVRATVININNAFNLFPGTQLVFNCTGLSARVLGGVEDKQVYPTRGQIVLIRAPEIEENICSWGSDVSTYIIPRPFSGGLVVLGGYQQKNNWNTSTYAFETESILERTRELLPEKLQPGQYTIVREVAGLRPSRIGGPRIEKEHLENGVLVHNYGASGTGYQAGYGMAADSIALVEDELAKISLSKL